MTCLEFYAFLDEFLEGALVEPLAQRFAAHIEMCLPCLRYLDTYRATLSVVRLSELTEDVGAAGAPEDLVRAIMAARAQGG